MNHDTSSLFHAHIAQNIAQTIAQHEGAEVFFVAWIDRDGLVSECEAIAFGNEEAVPAPLADGLKGDLVIHNHPSGDLRASNPDINIASLLATRKLGFYIINNTCTEVNVVYKPKPRFFLPESQVLSIFQENGALADLMGSYEKRLEQEKLVQSVIQSINDDSILMAEAGTGTGKSLSYLIPATFWAVKSDKRVFVTTHTITLQNQIANKDAEIVSTIIERITGIRPRFAVLVGKGNYLCPKGLNDLIHDQDKTNSLFDNTDSIANQLDIVATWAEKTQDGLRSEIPQKISNDLWEEISASTPNCPRRECPFYAECFYFKARMVAESAHIIIGNHALLLAAIDDESGFISTIPHFSGVVLDEAHNLAPITLSAMAESFSFGSVAWRLNRLYRQKKDKTFGQLSLLKDRMIMERHPNIMELFHKATGEILDLHSFLQTKEEEFRQLFSDLAAPSVEINDSFIASHPMAKGILEQVFDKVRFVEYNLTKLLAQMQELSPEDRILEILRVIEIHNLALHDMRQTFEKIFNNSDQGTLAVKQMELTSRVISFSAGPAEVGDFLAKHIFRPKDFTIFASATLSVNTTFDFFAEGIGLPFAEPDRIKQISLPSPFDYQNQMKIYVVDEKTLPYQQVEQAKLELVKEAVFISGGGALLLFTSYRAMDQAFSFLAQEFEQAGLYPLKQGDHSREFLLNTMLSKDYSVLFATASFWEGVDVPGEHLRFLVIDKLPFDNPNNPLTKAICKIIDDKGLNSFMNYSVPRAVLKYKQGIGRLIRSKKDRGVLLVLDSRIFTKKYGHSFIQAAMPAQSLYTTPNEIITQMKKFFLSNR